MKRTIGSLLFLLVFLSHHLCAYTLEWASVCPSNTDLFPQDNITDATGNVYNTGRYRGTTDLDPTAGVSSFTANGFTDAFIQKLDPAGNFLWVLNYTGGSWEQINGLTIDGAGNLYTIGHFGGTVDFDAGPGVFSLTSNGGNDLVILKLSPAGNLIWAISMGGVSNEEGLFIGCDASGNIYGGCLFSGSVDFDSGPGTSLLTATGGADVCIFKLDPSGNHLWAVSFGTTSSEALSGMDINSSGDIILTGSFSGSGDFNPNAGVYTMTAVAFSDIFFVKLNALGTFLWSSSLGSAGFDFSQNVCFTSTGEILVVGGFNNVLDFDPGPGTNVLTPTSMNGYLLKLNSAGNFLWVQQFSGFSMIPTQVDITTAGKIFLAGSFKGTVDFDPGPGVVSVTSGNIQTDAFVRRLDQNGAYEWHLDPEGAIDFDQLFAMTISTAGHAFFMGRFTAGSIDLLMGPGVFSITNSVPGTGNGFFFKLNAGSPLPVEWGQLDALPVANKVVIRWTTLSEINNDYFEIERSLDGFLWTVIGIEDGHGHSNHAINYIHDDFSPVEGILYYRIRQTDFNGHSALSEVVAVRYSDKDTETIHFSILQGNQALLLWSAQNSETVSVELFTPDGCILQHKSRLSLPAEIDLAGVSSQLIYIRVSCNTISTTYKHFHL
ncbi:MAG: hypothetical protein IPJ86_17595 [Bacteroidetes bacterium]|nr:hypothetical protein [Bacteroidota bacterium]